MMKKMKYLTVFVLVVFSSFTMLANDVLIHVIMDRLVYAKGEIAYGTIMVEGANLNHKIIKVEAKNIQNGKKIFDACIRMNNNLGEFYIPILSEYEAGAYTLTFLGLVDHKKILKIKNENLSDNILPKFSLDNKYPHRDEEIVQLASCLFNILGEPNEKKANIKHYYNPLSTFSFLNNDSLNILEVSNSEKSITFHPKGLETEKIGLVAVTDASQKEFGIQIITIRLDWDQAIFNNLSDKLFSSLNVKNKSNQKKFNLIGLYSDAAGYTFTSKSDETGEVIFKYHDFEGNQSFQLLVMNIESEEIQIDSVPMLAISSALYQEIQESKLNDIINDASLRKDIHTYFSIQTFDTEPPVRINKFDKEEAQKSYIIKNYKKFSDLKTFCLENDIPLTFMNKNNEYKAILSPSATYSKAFGVSWEKPLFLLDGRICKNIKQISTLKMEDIVQVNIYFDTKETKEWMSAFGNQGIITISTKEPKHNLKEMGVLTLSGLQPKITPIEELKQNALILDLPFLSPTIYWKTQIDNSYTTNILKNSDRTPKILSVFYKKNGKFFFSKALID